MAAGRSHSSRRPTRVRRRYHLRTPAYVYMLVTVLIAVGAFNSQNNLLFWAFGFALATLVVSGVLSGTMLMGLEVERRALGDARAGHTLVLSYTVRNRNSVVPAFAMRIEEIEPARVWWRRPAQAASPWTEHCDRPRVFVAHVGPREAVSARVPVLARRRGLVRFEGVRVISSFPFGLIRKTMEFPLPEEVVVTPRRAEPPARARDRLGRAGDAAIASRRQGPGDEFFALREYVEGDSPRAIAWRASARRMETVASGTGLLVRQNASPAPARLWVVLRLNPESAGAEDNERAISLATGLVEDAAEQGLSIGLAAPRAGVLLRPLTGQAAVLACARELGMLHLPALRASADDGRFPAAAAAPGALVVVVHAGAVDRTFGPGAGGPLHISSEEAGSEVGTAAGGGSA
ncbi:MAG: DUF58 domain-containing protein [Phycisphaeraceae bacterium]|nr:DUF58 domain-containing protein [Phycisphaeraceae bacterium]MBX3407509.1 DUF58 domain-containing protein [Phycisphaeraceae bacterium]